jgi:hypothetical protein
MTWSDLLDKYAPTCDEMFTLVLDADTKIQFDFLGNVHILNRGRYGINYFALAKNRTPDDMELIIKGLKGDCL